MGLGSAGGATCRVSPAVATKPSETRTRRLSLRGRDRMPRRGARLRNGDGTELFVNAGRGTGKTGRLRATQTISSS